MDQDRLLDEIRLLFSELDKASDDAARMIIAEIRMRFKRLDHGLSYGGVLPTAWKTAT